MEKEMKNLFFSLSVLACFGTTLGQKCLYHDPCTCTFDQSAGSVKFGVAGGVINLHRIADSGDPIFMDPREAGGKFFSYSPCSPYPCPYVADSALCVTTTKLKKTMDLGDFKDLTFNTTGNITTQKLHMSIKYKVSGSVVSIVHLVCSKTNEFRFEKNTSKTQYEFTLYSPCACVDGCLAAGISPGTIIVLIFFSLLLLYFGIGCLYKKVAYGATGQEILPNHTFWCSLPGLIKDGYLFFISPCLGDRAEYRVYDRL